MIVKTKMKQLSFILAIYIIAFGIFNMTPIHASTSDQSEFMYTVSTGNVTITGYKGMGGNVTIPAVIDGMNVTSIGSGAFSACLNLKSINLPSSLISIGNIAFYLCSQLTSINIPASVKMIGDSAFAICNNMTAITVEAGNTVFTSEDGVLFNKEKTVLMQYPCGKSDSSYIIPDSVTYISTDAFSNCNNLTGVDISDSVTSIGNTVFFKCIKLEKITVGVNNIAFTSEDGVLFSKTKTVLLQCPGGKTGNYTIPGSVVKISNGAFSSCSKLAVINIPDSVVSFGNCAFINCSGLTKISIPESVTYIGYSAFMDCSNLADISISSNVKDIGVNAFSNCSKLMTITVDSNNAMYSSEDGVLFNKAKAELLQYPGGKTGSNSIPESVNSVMNSAFFGCSNLTSVSIPVNVKSIGVMAFYNCSNLSAAYFYCNAPIMEAAVFYGTKPDFTVYYLAGKSGFSNPWNGYPTAVFTNDLSTPKQAVIKPVTPAAIIPAAPTGLSVTISGNKANLTWKAVKDVLSYKVYYKKQNGSYSFITTKNTKLQIVNLRKSSKYFFKVAAVYSAGEAKASTEISKTTGK